MFSSVMSMRRENAFVTEEVAGQFHGFRDRGHRDFTPPRPNNPLPRRAAGDLFQHLKHHDSRSLESRPAVANSRIGHDVFAKFNGPGLVDDFRFHAVAWEFALATACLQAGG
jgi:hypothetical protein